MRILTVILVFISFGLSQAYRRIINGQNATQGKFPYFVELEIQGEHENSSCGATLISQDKILTATHCLEGAQKITAIIGSIHRLQGRHFNVIRRPKILEADMSVLTLETPAVGTSVIELIDHPVKNNQNCTTVGYGYMKFGARPNVLQYVVLRINQKRDVMKKFEKQSKATDNYIFAGMFDDADSCFGDSGGPLICDGMLAGVVSGGLSRGCNTPEPAATAYGDVYKFREAIRKEIQETS